MSKHDVVIVGGGISGLSTLHYLRTRKPELSVRLLEAEERLGGTIGTDHIDGYSLDWGPNGFLDREPLTLELCEELGLKDSLERASAAVQKRFIVRGSRLREVPLSPVKFLKSDLLTVRGRLRILLEPFTPRNRDTDDESIYSFAQRHMGREAADYLIQPMVSGVYGGVADRLSLASCFPIMRKMEDEHGSLVRAMIAKKRGLKGKNANAGPAGPGGWLTSFRGGLYGIIERFEQLYGEFIDTGKQVTSIGRTDFGFEVRDDHDARLQAKHVVAATPSYISAGLAEKSSPGLAQALREIPYAPIAVVCLGFSRAAVAHDLDGFGFLVPQKEGRTILGSIWTSSIFSGRAPHGQVQLRSMVGGDGDHETPNLPDDQLVDVVMRDLESLLGPLGRPTLTKVYRWQKGIPQYVIGHRATLSRIEAELKRIEGFHIAGNAYFGIGLNDCVKSARATADAICASIT
jgi:oxygen-dependent protoporphyrinogen oxidase